MSAQSVVETVSRPTQAAYPESRPSLAPPPLHAGDRLSRAEFERRHQTYPEIAGRAADSTLSDLTGTGAVTLVTACPACKSAFLEQNHLSSPRIVDLVEVVAARI